MAFVDELSIEARAGRGGDGVVRWLHLKGKEFSGPAGGNGGDGGDVYLRAVSDLNLLSKYRGAKEFRAEDGAAGEGRGRHGKRGDDLYIEVPAGSVVVNETTGERYELLTSGQTALVLKGGRGGAGNAVFKSSVNRSPTESTQGIEGEHARLSIELKLIADAGLVGLPNAGKSTLLNALTGASAKTGAYAFTTLDPNLGALFEFVLADIPGLIEGASKGKGLGSKFLRHISRTKLILHCISLESSDPLCDHRTVREELRHGDIALAQKPEMIILTKSDLVEGKHAKLVAAEFAALGREVHIVSSINDEELKDLRDAIVAALRKA